MPEYLHLFTIFLLCLFSTNVDASIIFVSTNGTDSSNCGVSIAQACKTIQFAVYNATSGSSIVLLPGIFTGEGNTNITLQNNFEINFYGYDENTFSTIQCSQSNFSSYEFNFQKEPSIDSQNNYVAFYISSPQPLVSFRYITFQNCEVAVIAVNSIVNFESCAFNSNGNSILAHESIVNASNSVFSKNHNLFLTNNHTVSLYKNSSFYFGSCLFEENMGSIYSQNSTVLIEDSTFSNNQAIIFGAALFSTNSNISIFHSSFVENFSSKYGGALAFENSNFQLSYCIFDQNTAWSIGGAIHISPTGSIGYINYCNFSRNASPYGAVSIAACGECVTNFQISSVSFQDSYFDANTGVTGGAISSSQYGTMYVGDCGFIGNSAQVGGAVYVRSTSLVSNNNFFYDNQAVNGGGIRIEDVSLSISIEYNVFISNEALDYGGGVSMFSGQEIAVVNCTFVENRGLEGGAISIRNVESVQVGECFFQTNSAGEGGGIHLSSAETAIIQNSQFFNNFGNSGGAATITGFRTFTSFNDCKFIGNTAEIGNFYVVFLSHNQGGAANLSAIDSFLSFSQCDFINNTANGGYGGVAYLSGVVAPPTANFTFCNFVNNSAPWGFGAVVFVADGSFANFTSCNITVQRNNSTRGQIGAIFGTNLCASSVSGSNFTYCNFGDTLLEYDFVIEGVGSFVNITNTTNTNKSSNQLYSLRKCPPGTYGYGNFTDCLPCEPGEYAFQSTIGACNSCPPQPLVINQTSCAKLISINETSYAYSISEGYFPAPFHLAPQFLMTCSGKACQPFNCSRVCILSPEDNDIACNVTCTNPCSPGYEDRLCARCVCETTHNCYYSNFGTGTCVKCEIEGDQKVIIPIFAVALILISAAFAFFAKSPSILVLIQASILILMMLLKVSSPWQINFILVLIIVYFLSNRGVPSGVIKALFFYLQSTNSLIPSFFWPTWAHDAAIRLQIFNLIKPWGLECISPNVFTHPVARYIYAMLFPVGLYLFMILLLLLSVLVGRSPTLRKIQNWSPEKILQSCRNEVTKCVPYTPRAPSKPPSRFASNRTISALSENAPLIRDRSSARNSRHNSAASRGSLRSRESIDSRVSSIRSRDNDPLPEPMETIVKSTTIWGETKMMFSKFTHIFLFLLSVTHFELSNRTLAILAPCQPDPGNPSVHYMANYPWIVCSNSNNEWLVLVAVASLFLIFYVLGFPAFICYLTFKFRRNIAEDDDELRMWFGFIYTCYKKKRKTAFWFEMVYIGRRLVLSMIIALYPSNGLFRSILVVLLLLISLEIYIIVRPYASRLENYLENLGIITVLLTFIAVLAYQHRLGNSLGAFSNEPEIFQNVILGFNGLTLFLFVCGLAKTPVMHIRAFFSEKVLNRKFELMESLRSDEDLYDPNISFFFLDNEKPAQGMPK